MRTNVVIDDKLMKAAMKASGLKTKRETIEAGLREIVRKKKIEEFLALRGKLKWEGDLDEMRRDKAREPY